jgi:hypothetical protein
MGRKIWGLSAQKRKQGSLGHGGIIFDRGWLESIGKVVVGIWRDGDGGRVSGSFVRYVHVRHSPIRWFHVVRRWRIEGGNIDGGGIELEIVGCVV